MLGTMNDCLFCVAGLAYKGASDSGKLFKPVIELLWTELEGVIEAPDEEAVAPITIYTPDIKAVMNAKR